MRVLLAGVVLLASSALFADQKPNVTPKGSAHHLREKYHSKKRAGHAAATRCQHLVTVINGDSPMTTCSDLPSSGAVSSRRAGTSLARENAGSGRVEIINGTAWSTRTFSATEKQLDVPPAQRAKAHPVVTGIASSAIDAEKPQPVVVAVASSEMAGAVANAQPVVVGIASSGFDSNRSVAPVAVGVAPVAPKRPPYHRPDPQ